jgi:hypothetical protein
VGENAIGAFRALLAIAHRDCHAFLAREVSAKCAQLQAQKDRPFDSNRDLREARRSTCREHALRGEFFQRAHARQ